MTGFPGGFFFLNYPKEEKKMFFLVVAAFAIPFAAISGFYWCLDNRTRGTVTTAIYKRIWPVVLYNFVLVQCPLTYLFLQWKEVTHTPEMSVVDRLVDTFDTITFCVLAADVVFYLTHRWMHLPWWFQKVHKVHHSLHDTVAVGAMYCHPLEHALVNVLSSSVGLLILPKPELFAVCLYSILAAISSATAHAGTPLHPHTKHHQVGTTEANFGILGIMDRLCKTSLH